MLPTILVRSLEERLLSRPNATNIRWESVLFAIFSGQCKMRGHRKGILVTTSGYGRASHEFANGKPLELLDGANLLYLLKEHAAIDARIEPPEDWVDPIQDS